MKMPQSTSAVLMISPRSFGFDEQTAATNTFQKRPDENQSGIREKAIKEFDAMVKGLRANHITVVVANDKKQEPPKPSAVFPNNWLSMWPNGEVYLYPMATESRRNERTAETLDQLAQTFIINHVTDMTASEADGKFLESTGVMVFDHQHKIVYACSSSRCNAALFRAHAKQLGYLPVLFHAYYQPGSEIYHTNIAMAIQSTTAIVCAEAITDKAEQASVLESLKNSGHEVISITRSQMESYCANVLELRNKNWELLLAMSKSAFDALTDTQRQILSRDKKLLPFDINTIEAVGGGSARCMLAEIFLPHR
jgi:hypothetical protein